jgi:hypothetical protein
VEKHYFISFTGQMALTFRYLITQRLLCLAYPIFQNTLPASKNYHSIKMFMYVAEA